VCVKEREREREEREERERKRREGEEREERERERGRERERERRRESLFFFGMQIMNEQSRVSFSSLFLNPSRLILFTHCLFYMTEF
jgi:hypothetical protein